jgi:hypothetical protein
VRCFHLRQHVQPVLALGEVLAHARPQAVVLALVMVLNLFLTAPSQPRIDAGLLVRSFGGWHAAPKAQIPAKRRMQGVHHRQVQRLCVCLDY